MEYPLYCSAAITPTRLEASAGLISKVILAGISLYFVVLSTALASGWSLPVTVNVAVPALILLVNVAVYKFGFTIFPSITTSKSGVIAFPV